MSMHAKGLTKLQEECGELIQIAAKKAAYLDTDEHPDGKGSMKARLEEEMGDVLAAMTCVSHNLGLDWFNVLKREKEKVQIFKKWDGADWDEDE